MPGIRQIDPHRRNGLQQVPSVVLCNSTAVAQAIIGSLGLRRTSALRLRPLQKSGLSAAASVEPPQLAVIMESDIGAVVHAIRALRQRWPAIKIVVGGLPNQEEPILRAFAAGAHGVLLEDEPLSQLAQAVEDVLIDKYRLPPQLIYPFLERLFRLESTSPITGRGPPLARLSAREVEILNCLTQGHTNKAIAEQLHVEVQTVKNHVTQILRKLCVHTRFDAIRVAAGHTRGAG